MFFSCEANTVQSRGTMTWRYVYGSSYCSSWRTPAWRKHSERRHFCPSSFSPTVSAGWLQTSVKLLPSDSNLDLGEQTQKVLLPSISTWKDSSGGLWWAGTPRNSKTVCTVWKQNRVQDRTRREASKETPHFLYITCITKLWVQVKFVEYDQKAAADHLTDNCCSPQAILDFN